MKHKMKRIILSLVFVLSVPILSRAAYYDSDLINSSSFTTTADTLQAIAPAVMAGGILVGVYVSSPSTVGLLTLFDANATSSTVSRIASVPLLNSGSSSFYVPFNVRVSSGITYSVSVATPVTIIYKVTRPR